MGLSLDQKTNMKGDYMNKAELVALMAKETDISKAKAKAALDAFTDGVTKALKQKDGKVTLTGFGTFVKIRRKARKGRDPNTGKTIKIKAKNVARFRAGKNLKESI